MNRGAMSIFTGGKIKKQRLKPAACTIKGQAVVDAVLKVMSDELSPAACERWRSLVNAELGFEAFRAVVQEPESDASAESVHVTVPRVWVPSKPKLTLALLDQIEQEVDGVLEPQACVGAQGSVRKIVARLAVDRMRAAKGESWLADCGELAARQRDNEAKLLQVLSKVAFSLIVYVHARANDLVEEEGQDCLIALHNSEQSLGGRGMRGCGIVYCDAGGAVVKRVLQLVRNGLAAYAAV